MNYLSWLSQTPTKWWHDSAISQEIVRAKTMGALGVTTNPVLTYKALCAFPEEYDLPDLTVDMPFEERAETLLRIVAMHAGSFFTDIFEKTNGENGYAFGQLNPTKATNAQIMLEMAQRVASWAPNIAVKLPSSKAGIAVIEELAAKGIAICATLNFSVAQAVAVAQSYARGCERARQNGVAVRPCFAVQQIGRVDDYIRDCNADINAGLTEEEIIWSGLAIAKRSYAILQEMGSQSIIMPAGLRGVYHVTQLAGARMTMSLHPRIQQMVLDSDLPRELNIDMPIDKNIIQKLMRIPEFVRAYEPDGLKPEEFSTYGLFQRTLSQFVETGWAPLETYGSTQTSTRWT